MFNYDLPFGYSRMDSVSGTVVRSSHVGIEVALDAGDSDSPGPATAFVRCGGRIGQRVLVSLKYFNKGRGNFYATLDSYLDDGPARAGMAALNGGGRPATVRAA